MGNFTITQTPKPKNIYLYPDNEGCTTDFTPVGELENWKCTKNEYNSLAPEEEYVYMRDAPLKRDAYTIDDPPSGLAGIINYVKVICSAKSDEFPPAYDAVFKLFIAQSGQGHEILTLRPNGDGAFTQWLKNTTYWWEAVDEEVCDDGVTHIREGTNGDKCYFILPNHTTETGTITDVTVHACCGNGPAGVKLVIYDAASTNRLTHSITWGAPGYFMKSHSFPTNPNGGSWTWTAIDNLQIGVEKESGSFPYISQMYVEITHEEGTTCDPISVSDNQQLSTGWNKFSYNLITSPFTTNAWTWTELANLQVGVDASSPDVIVSPFVIAPTGDGDRTDIYSATSGYDHWEAVEKEHPETQVCEYGAVWAYDLYRFLYVTANAPIDPSILATDHIFSEECTFVSYNQSSPFYVYKRYGAAYEELSQVAPNTTPWNPTVPSTYSAVDTDGTYYYISEKLNSSHTRLNAYSFDGTTLTLLASETQYFYIEGLSILDIHARGGIVYTPCGRYFGANMNVIYSHYFNGTGFTMVTWKAFYDRPVKVLHDGTYLYTITRYDRLQQPHPRLLVMIPSSNFPTIAEVNLPDNGRKFDVYGEFIFVTTDSGLEIYKFSGGSLTHITSKAEVEECYGIAYYKNWVIMVEENYLRAYSFDGTTLSSCLASYKLKEKIDYCADVDIHVYGDLIQLNYGNVMLFKFNGIEFDKVASTHWTNIPVYLPDTTTIAALSVVAKMGKEYDAPDEADIRGCFIIKTHNTEYKTDTDYIKLEYPQRLYAHTWTTNPNTGSAWTIAEAKALQAGIGLYGNNEKYAACSRCYIVLSTTSMISPKIKMCQEHAKVNYQADDVVCTLPKPQKTSRDHDRNVKMINFWSGKRVVYDLSRSGKNMVMTGKVFDQDCGTLACDAIKCVESLAEEGTPVTITGLNFSSFNGEFRILSFGYKHTSEKPEAWEWILELEDNTV